MIVVFKLNSLNDKKARYEFNWNFLAKKLLEKKFIPQRLTLCVKSSIDNQDNEILTNVTGGCSHFFDIINALVVFHHPVKFGDLKQCGNGDLMFLTFT